MSGRSCFVILHYGENTKITMDAVRAIQKLKNADRAEIVIVCNGAQFDLRTRVDAAELENIEVVVLPDNLGFSAGNNVGYAHAKARGDYDFIIIMNNDVIIEQADFLERLQQAYDRHPFFVGGPDVYTPAIAHHSSPLRSDLLSPEDLDRIIRNREEQNQQLSRRISLFALKSYLLEAFSSRRILESVFRIWRKVKKSSNGYDKEQSDVVLQGSFLIFSKDYICQNEKAFEPEVFLYFEEYYLTQRCRKNGWKVFYSPEMKVIHMHRGSSGLLGQSFRTYCEKRILINSRFIKAAKEAKEILYGVSQ